MRAGNIRRYQRDFNPERLAGFTRSNKTRRKVHPPEPVRCESQRGLSRFKLTIVPGLVQKTPRQAKRILKEGQ